MFKGNRLRPSIAMSLALIASGSCLLIWISTHNLLLFHSLVELFSIVISASVFIVAFNTRNMVRDGFIKMIAVPLFFVAILEALHLLAYEGLAVFEWANNNLPTQLWIASRGLQSVSMLVATLFVGRDIRMRWPLAIYGAITVGILSTLFVWPLFPVCYVAGQGLTTFKLVAEYVISAIFLCTMGSLWMSRHAFDTKVFWWLQAALALMILAELAFTRYAGVFDVINIVGHIVLYTSTLLVYQAVVETGLRRPFGLIFRDLKLSEQRFRTVADFTHDWEIWQAPDGRFEYVSPSCERITGYAVRRFVDAPELFFEIAHPQDRAAVRAHFGQHAHQQQPGEADFRIITREGEERWISHVCMPVYEDGQFLGIRASNRDITQRKRAEGDRELLIARLEQSLAEINQLTGLIPICASCKSVRTDEGYWQSVEEYLQARSEAGFTHGICPDCMRRLYPELVDESPELAGDQDLPAPA